MCADCAALTAFGRRLLGHPMIPLHFTGIWPPARLARPLSSFVVRREVLGGGIRLPDPTLYVVFMI